MTLPVNQGPKTMWCSIWVMHLAQFVWLKEGFKTINQHYLFANNKRNVGATALFTKNPNWTTLKITMKAFNEPVCQNNKDPWKTILQGT